MMDLNDRQTEILVKLIGGLNASDMERLDMTPIERALIASMYSLALHETFQNDRARKRPGQ